jgi:hypothetical protein
MLSLSDLGTATGSLERNTLLAIYDFLDVPGQGDDYILPKQDLPA